MKQSDGRPKQAALPHLTHPDLTHAIVHALQKMDYDVSEPAKFLKTVQNVDFGLTAECEFATIASWLGHCVLVHELGQDRLSSPPVAEAIAVPDLLCIVEQHGKRQPLLIEVKTTKPATISGKVWLSAKRAYLDSLQRYSDALEIPLLIAWRSRSLPFWMLFDPQTTPYDEAAQRFHFGDAIKHDLMSAVFGDRVIVPRENAGLTIKMDILRKTPKSDGYVAHLRVSEAYWNDSVGNRLDSPRAGVITVLIASSEEQTTEEDAKLVTTFSSNGGSTRSQSVLRTLAQWALPENHRIHWRRVGRSLDRYLPHDTLMSDVESSFGSCIQYVFIQHPGHWPSFLPSEWNRVEEQAPTEADDAKPNTY